MTTSTISGCRSAPRQDIGDAPKSVQNAGLVDASNNKLVHQLSVVAAGAGSFGAPGKRDGQSFDWLAMGCNQGGCDELNTPGILTRGSHPPARFGDLPQDIVFIALGVTLPVS